MTVTDLWAPAAFDESLYRASELFTWLAMERTESFLPRFGLGRVDAAHLRAVAREYLTMYDGLALRADAEPPPVQFEHALEAIGRHDGQAARATVAMWHAIGIPDGSAYSRAMIVWFDVLHGVAFDQRMKLETGLLAAVRPILRGRISPHGWLQEVDAAKQPMDEWEVGYYAMWDEAVGHGTSPIDGLRDALNFNDLHDAWFHLRQALPDETLKAFRKWVEGRAKWELWCGAMPPPEREGWQDWRAPRGTATLS